MIRAQRQTDESFTAKTAGQRGRTQTFSGENDMTPKSLLLAVLALWLTSAGCATQHRVEVAPVEVKPIHITIDVNIKVDRALDDFFGDLDQKASTMKDAAESSPKK